MGDACHTHVDEHCEACYDLIRLIRSLSDSMTDWKEDDIDNGEQHEIYKQVRFLVDTYHKRVRRTKRALYRTHHARRNTR